MSAPRQVSEHVTAYDLAKELLNERGDLSFGVDVDKCAQTLRVLADRIESGAVLITGARVYTRTDVEEFTLTSFNLKFSERKEKR